MIPTNFDYVRAASVPEAIQLLKNCKGEGKIIAGGHSLVPLMKFRITSPGTLIDISKIQELKGVKKEGGRLVIGALTTYAEALEDPLISTHIPVLADAIKQIGDLQVRNKGTIGGNIAHADPAADLPALALALDAFVYITGEDGDEKIPIQEFLFGPFITALPETSLVTAISFAIPPTEGKSSYLKYFHPASGYAVVGVAAVARKTVDGTINHIRIGITGSGDCAYRAESVEKFLLGKKAVPEIITEAALLAADDAEMGEDTFASSEYRKHLCQVYTERALRAVLI
ncbi:FAD binding domain-containing protein [Neobacillus mesonae]|uniref:Carbon monoxide dehydrogenase n=1 Tax=Neobacillus mesonae TaxID=1193713 RepID=A0A3T0I0C9_9BACI|nr:xanthine dehydrogenase family protein subunit M [Neobacillus mesonae]AZU62861.1 carbon monoxide dehydrogenase [Neobacillus mesonae]